ncbi:MAG: hypothetical protein CBD57_04635 [Candidatus Pelagibacter sp. TMED197]|jgi:hypothetical protein|nr:MAG: hypothetical protein CBD57_04635 [Candidatus Pelagibacter sp. TMED197]|tara:strand:- start:1213 stop:1833 length:621 start_codon:yes stop_codon:yes gene_type:complete
MMKNNVKIIGAIGLALMLNACAGGTYKIKSENGKTMNQVPKWYMADYSERKACDTDLLGKGKDKECLFGVATSVSPDLQLAIEKAKMYAKSEIADIVAGEMNKQSKQFITELGKTHSKTTVSEVESTLVNIIKDTKVRGYEIWKQDVTLTKNGYYRAWIGLRLPLGEYNKMYNYTIEEAVDAYNVKEKANIAYKEVLENKDDNNSL